MNFLTQEMLDMTYPNQYYKNVIEPAKTGRGPVPSKMQMLSRAQPFKAMRIGLDPYLPKSMQAGYDAFRAAPTTGAARFLGSNIASGLPLAYAYGANQLQESLPESLQGEGGIYDIAGYDDPMSAGASFMGDEALRYGDRPNMLSADLGAANYQAPSNPTYTDMDDLEGQDINRQRMEDLMRLASMEQYPQEDLDTNNNLTGITDLASRYGMPIYNFIRGNIGAGALGLLNPLAGLAMLFGGGNRTPSPQRLAQQNFMRNYNVEVDHSGRMTSGPFQGQNLFGTSAFGSKTAEEQAQKNLDKWGKTASEDKIKTWENIVAGGKKTPKPKVTAIHSPHQHHGGGGGGGGMGKGQDPGGGAEGSPFNRGGLAALWQRY